jgi:hypothetical protein
MHTWQKKTPSLLANTKLNQSALFWYGHRHHNARAWIILPNFTELVRRTVGSGLWMVRLVFHLYLQYKNLLLGIREVRL